MKKILVLPCSTEEIQKWLSNLPMMLQLVGDKTGDNTHTVGPQSYPYYTRYKLLIYTDKSHITFCVVN